MKKRSKLSFGLFLFYTLMYYAYILYSEKRDRFYIGYSSNPEKRLTEKHNKGYVKATKPGIPYRLVAKKQFSTELEAQQEELKLKKIS